MADISHPLDSIFQRARFPTEWAVYEELKETGLAAAVWEKLPRSRREHRADRAVYHDRISGNYYAEEHRRLALPRVSLPNESSEMDYARALDIENEKRYVESEWLRCAPLLGFATPRQVSFAYHARKIDKPPANVCGFFGVDYRGVTAMSAAPGKSLATVMAEPDCDAHKKKTIFEAAYQAQIITLVCGDPYRSPRNVFVDRNRFTHIGFEGIRQPEYMVGQDKMARASVRVAEAFVGSRGILERHRVLNGLDITQQRLEENRRLLDVSLAARWEENIETGRKFVRSSDLFRSPN